MKRAKSSHIWLLPFFYLGLCLNEAVLRAVTAQGFWRAGLGIACLFALVPALAAYVLCRLFPPKMNRVLELVLSWFFFLFYASQLVYFKAGTVLYHSVLIRRYWFLSLSLEIGSIFIAWLHKSI